MHHFKRLITAIILTLLSIILLFSAAFAYLIVTPLGGKILVRYFKQEFTSVGLLHVGHYEGSLQDGFVLKDLNITGLAYCPDALLRIQEIHVRLPLWDLGHSDFRIFNARIFFPYSDPVVFTGHVFGGQIQGNLYARSVDLHEASRFWANEEIKKNLQGFITNMDVSLQGPLSAPVVKGNFLIDNISYNSFVLTNGLSRINLTFSSIHSRWPYCLLKGGLMVDSGFVRVRGKDLNLTQSNVMFHGDVLNPLIDVHLGGKVEDMDIHITINGPLLKPQLTVSSDPPMPPQEALQVLFSGNALSMSTSPFNGLTSSELAENFLDYSLQDIHDDQQFGLKTKLTDHLKLGLELDQLPTPPGETSIYYSRKVNGEMDLNQHMSLNISQEVLPQNNYSYSGYQDTAQPASETQVYVQYKKRF